MAKIIQFPGASEEEDGDDFRDDTGMEDRQEDLPREDVQILGPMGRSGPEFAILKALYGKDLESVASTFEIDTRMTHEDIQAVPVLGRVRELLNLIGEAERVKMTPAGYLPVALVGKLVNGAYGELPRQPRSGSPREMDIRHLRLERTLAVHAGLLEIEGGWLKLSGRGEQLLSEMESSSPEQPTTALNQMYEYLLRTYLGSAEDLDEWDRGNLNDMIPKAGLLFLFALAGKQGELVYQEDLVDLLARLLPTEFRTSIARSAGEPLEMFDWDIYRRFFQMFAVPFGLCTEQEPHSFREPFASLLAHREWWYLKRDHGPWLVNDLFSRVFLFHQEAPSECFLSDRQAALLLTDLAAGSTFEYFAERYCVKAIERDPQCAEAYVLLASIKREKPQRALQVLEAGIAAGADQKPDLPSGVSVWRDHMYRDVMRLRFARAEYLVTMGRHAEAITSYQALLQLDSEDNIGVRYKLVPLLIAGGRVEEAEHLVEAFAGGTDEAESAFVRWNRTLIAYAQGGAKQAGPLLEAAMRANEYVVEELLYIEPFPEMMPDSYYIGSPEEAMVYAEESQLAWRKVKGVRAWLRRKVEG
ncbi:MAG: tetratricopeptide repeat protein [Spirochaetaceae bacterium]|nr:MAG: tetratricopeptide repeat protein [Spirochaetaceae bacterium]